MGFTHPGQSIILRAPQEAKSRQLSIKASVRHALNFNLCFDTIFHSFHDGGRGRGGNSRLALRLAEVLTGLPIEQDDRAENNQRGQNAETGD